MDKTIKRRNIIVVVAVLAVLYGLFGLATASRIKKGGPAGAKAPAELQAFISQISADLGGGGFDSYVVSRAERPLGRNPFFRKGTKVSGKVSGRTPDPAFSYKGYIEAGGRGLAVINNAEYKAGEQLEQEGFFLKEISPSRVVIENRPAKTEFAVPLHE